MARGARDPRGWLPWCWILLTCTGLAASFDSIFYEDDFNDFSDWNDHTAEDLDVTGDGCKPPSATCSNGICIRRSWLCDGVEDCPDGEDEENCHTDCMPYEFRCDNGVCISGQFQCDGDVDCEDASDEMSCNQTVVCNEEEVLCNDRVECVLRQALCDGEPDCADGSDEQDCEGFTCSPNQFRCGNTTDCIPNIWKCDGFQNCQDGSDEICSEEVWNCETFRCEDKSKCLDYKSVCDGHADCLDGSDEADNCSLECRKKPCSYACTWNGTDVTCVCPKGFVVHPERNHLCQDVDECAAVPYRKQPPCSQQCINTRGSYHCVCSDPYALEPNGQTCRMRHPDPVLLLSGYSEILSFNLRQQGDVLEMVQTGLQSVGDMEVDSKSRRLFWVDKGDRKIYYTKLTWEDSQTDKPVYVNVGLVSPQGLSYNWHADLLYVLDSFQGIIVACTVEGLACAVLVEGLHDRQPSDLLVDPMARYLYWTENQHPTVIMRSDLDGRNREAFLRAHMMYMHHLLIDYPTNRLYWIDTKVDAIYHIPLDAPAKNRIRSMRVFMAYGIQHPTALVVLEDWVVWAEKKSGIVMKVNKWTGGDRERLVKLDDSVTGAIVLHPALQPNAGDNACQRAHCTQVCVESRNEKGFTCVCPPEMVLLPDGLTCNWVRTTPFLLVGSGDHIIQMPSFNIGHINLRQLRAEGLRGIRILDVNPLTQEVVVGAITSDGKPVVMKTTDIWNVVFSVSIIEDREEYLGQPLSLAVDWVADQVFWLNGQRNTIEIFSTDGKRHSRLTFEGVEDMRAIAINVTQGLLFYCTWGEQPRIVRCHMDGTNCSIIVERKAHQPYYLLSFGDRLYWSDASMGHISSVLLDGSDRIRQVALDSPKEFALHKHLYYHDNMTESIHLYDMETTVAITDYHFPSVDVQDLVMLIPRDTVPDLPCAQNNGGCSDICVSLPDGGHRCLCPLGKSLAEDQRTCRVLKKTCLPKEVLCKSSDTCILKSDLCGEHVTCQTPAENVLCLYDIPEGKAECRRPNRCQQLCTMDGDRPVCSCDHGYYLTSDLHTCEDIDECSIRNGNCSQLCHNSRGSYSCSCVAGFRLIGDKATCHSADHDSAYLMVLTQVGFTVVEMDGEREYPLSMLSLTPLTFDMTLYQDWPSYHTRLQNPADVDVPLIQTNLIVVDGSIPFVKRWNGTSERMHIADMQVKVVRVDQVTKNVYFSGLDHGAHTIVVCNNHLQRCRQIMSGRDWQPASLVFHPARRMMYWNDLTSRTLGAAYMDGEGKTTVMESVDSVPNGLTICTVQDRLYWIDLRQVALSSTIHSVRLDGSDRYTVESIPQKILVSMDVFEGFLFLTEKNSHSLYKMSTFSSRPVLAEMRRMAQEVKDLRVVHSPPDVTNPCSTLDCSDLCILSRTGAACVCPQPILFSRIVAGCVRDKTTSPTPQTPSPPHTPAPLPPRPQSTPAPGQRPSPSTPSTQWSNNRPLVPPSTTRLPPSEEEHHQPSPSYEACSGFCQNRAFCQVANGKPVCMCSLGYRGRRCEVPIPTAGGAVSQDNVVVNATNHTTPSTQSAPMSSSMGTGGVVAIVLVVLVAVGVAVAAFVFYQKKRTERHCYAGVEFRMESDEASLVPGNGHGDDFYYCKWDLDGSMLDSSGSSNDSAVYSNANSPTPIYNPTPIFNPFNHPQA